MQGGRITNEVGGGVKYEERIIRRGTEERKGMKQCSGKKYD